MKELSKKKKIVYLCAIIVAIIILVISFILIKSFINKDRSNMLIKEKIKAIDEYVTLIKSKTDVERFISKADSSVLGSKTGEYLKAFGMDEIDVIIEKYDGSYIKVEPYADLDVQTFYYKDNKLVLYEIMSSETNGKNAYYFSNDSIIKIVRDDNFTNEESQSDILSKSKRVYEKYR